MANQKLTKEHQDLKDEADARYAAMSREDLIQEVRNARKIIFLESNKYDKLFNKHSVANKTIVRQAMLITKLQITDEL